jgi:hypothetical protein
MYGIMMRDRKGRTALLGDRFSDHRQANISIKAYAEALVLARLAEACHHRVGNSVVCYTNWQNDYAEFWRVSV